MSNLRASVYSIPIVDRHESKKIAGRIVPAIASSTSVVSGFAAAELIKIIQKRRTTEDYRNLFFNLANPQVIICYPGAVKKEALSRTVSTTIWDRWEVRQGDITLKEFLDEAQILVRTKVSAVFFESRCIYNSLMPNHVNKFSMKISQLIKGFTTNLSYVDLLCVFEEEEEEEEEEVEDDRENAGGAIIRFYFK